MRKLDFGNCLVPLVPYGFPSSIERFLSFLLNFCWRFTHTIVHSFLVCLDFSELGKIKNSWTWRVKLKVSEKVN